MTKKLLTIFLIVSGLLSAQTTPFVLSYSFTNVSSTTTPCTGTLDPTPAPSATGLTSGSFIAVGTSSCPSTSGFFSFAGWGTGATNGNDASFTGSLDLTKYYNITITPSLNYELAFDSIIFKALRSSTGPRHWAVCSNVTGYGTPLSATSTNTNISIVSSNTFFWSTDTYTTTTAQSGLKITLGAPTFTNLTIPISFRWYAWDGESTAGTFRISNVKIYGSATLATAIAKITHDINAHFIISPNPVNSNIVQITPQNIKEITFVEIIDALGNVIYKNTKIDVNNNIFLNIDNIPSGLYYVRLGSQKNYFLEKMIVAKQ